MKKSKPFRKFSKAKIEEARRRLDKSSRGSNEEYYTHLLAVNEEFKILRRRLNSIDYRYRAIYKIHERNKDRLDKFSVTLNLRAADKDGFITNEVIDSLGRKQIVNFITEMQNN